MGLFSSKTRIYTATQTLSLVEDTPNVIQQSVVGSLLGNTDISTDLLNTSLNLFTRNIRSYYRYGRDEYTNGLPEGTLKAVAVDTTLISPIISSLFPAPEFTTLKILTAVLDTEYPVLSICREYIQDLCEYDPTTDALGVNPWVPSNGYLASELCAVNKTTGVVTIWFKYTETVIGPSGNPTVIEKTANINITPATTYDSASYYYAVEYSFVSLTKTINPNTVRYWTYKLGAGTYPSLDVMPSSGLGIQFYPIIPLRISNKSLTGDASKDTELYKTSKKLLKKVSLSISELDEGVNGNPDIDSVDHAYVVLGIDPRQSTDDVAEYLYRFFDSVRPKLKYSESDFTAWKNSQTNASYSYITPPVNTITVKDGTFDTDLNFYYISVSLKAGSIGPVGTYTSTYTGDKNMILGTAYDYDDPEGGITLRCQLTTGMYRELYVAGLSQTTAMYQAKDHIVTLKSDENEVILVPLSYDILAQMPNLRANEVCYHSLKVVFHAYEKKKLKWYQSGFFSFVTIVVAVAISIVTQQWQVLVASISTAVGAGVAAMAILAAKAVVMTILINATFRFIAKEFGVGVALALSLVATAYGLSGQFIDGGLPMADSILSITGPGFNAVSEYQQAELSSLYSQIASYQAEVATKYEEIQAVRDSLDQGQKLFDPMQIYTAVDMPYFESPSAFVTRKTTTNVADLVGYSSIVNYVDNALDLTVI